MVISITLSGMHPLYEITQTLWSSQSFPLRDPIWGNLLFPQSFQALLEAEQFKKIRGIKQLGPCHLIYPGASHDRFSHSLGVYWTGFRFLDSFARKQQALDCMSREGLLSFLVACLCHDLGHFPYTHSLKELALREHEALTADLVLENPLKSLIEKTGAKPEYVAAIVDFDREAPNEETLMYRRLLSGVLDPDKLDYLKRDAYFCGVPYGTQDMDFLLSRISLNKEGRLFLAEEDSSILEQLLFSKYLMYKAVYWHRDVRIATAMIKKFLYIHLLQGHLKDEDLYGLDDAQFQALCENLEQSYPGRALAQTVRRGALYKKLWEVPAQTLNRNFLETLGNPQKRFSLETELLQALSGKLQDPSWDIIIDIPEDISFESDFPLQDAWGNLLSFSQARSVFSPPVVKEFTASLRKLRVLVHPDYDLNPQKAAEICSLFFAGEARV